MTVTGDKPKDLSPLIRLPKLQFAQFGEMFKVSKPRDYSPMAEAPMLRELVVLGCPPVEMEVAAINAGLVHWDDLLFADTPRPLPPLKMMVAPESEQPAFALPVLGAGETFDPGLRACEGRWVGEYIDRQMERLTGNPHWGATRVNGEAQTFSVEVYSMEIVEIFPEFLTNLRQAMARLRREYTGAVMIMLQDPPAKPTLAQIQEEERLQEEQNNADFEEWRRDQEEYLDRLHRYELRKEEGGPINPEEFSVPVPQPISLWRDGDQEDAEEFLDDEDEEDDDLDEDEEAGVFDDLDSSFSEQEHPLADHYRLAAYLKLDEIWFLPHQRDLAIQLMGHDPDLEIP